MSNDGWSHAHNEPAACAKVTTTNLDIYLADTIDTSGHSHTSDYLVDVAVISIKKREKQFGCKVCSVVTDNAANVSKMRQKLETQDNVGVTEYGYSAHRLNLLAQDLAIPNIEVVQVVKYFRNNHFAAATYKANEGLRLIMPQDVRSSILADCLEYYLKH